MKIEKLFPSDIVKLMAQQTNIRQVFPNFLTHSQALTIFCEAIQQRKNQQCVLLLEKNHAPLLFQWWCQDDRIFISNLLTIEGNWGNRKNISFSTIVQSLEKFAKSQWQSKIVIDFKNANNYWQERFEKADFQWQSESYFEKELDYRTALVLGGGGARGAYQIGVWQALDEMEISIKIITGTSVGALNGALMLQDDLISAKDMWQKIATQQILDIAIPESHANLSTTQLLQEIGQLTVTAIREIGVSTAPLEQLINEKVNHEKIAKSDKIFAFPVTSLPKIQERDILLTAISTQDLNQWLLATSSFFPAMAPAEIDGNYYMDGGYRNNLPIDLALAQGATEILTVDVKGPGFNKKVAIPQNVLEVQLKSRWSLGTVLLFDGERAQWNMRLGYLETLRKFEKYDGQIFTFEKKANGEELFESLALHFYHYLQQNVFQINAKDFSVEFQQLTKKLRIYYREAIKRENFGLALMEVLAQLLAFSPTEIYTQASLMKQILAMIQQDEWEIPKVEGEEMLWSLPEWGKWYQERILPFSFKQQVSFFLQKIAGGQDFRKGQPFWSVAPAAVCMAQWITFLKQKQLQEGEHLR